MSQEGTGSLGVTLRGVVDRFEGDWAVIALDDGRELLWPKGGLPEGAKPGMAVVVSLAVDVEDTEARRARIRGLQDEIFG